MLDVFKRSIIPVLGVMLTGIALYFASYGWLVFSLPLLFLGIYDWLQTKQAIIRNYPIAGRFRWFFLKLRPFFRAYFVEDDLSGTPYAYEARQLIHERATGKTDTHPFGTERNTDQADYHWLCHSVAPAREVVTEPRIKVGNFQCSKPYSSSLLNISAMSFGALSANAVEALNLAAKTGKFYQDTGEGGISNYHLRHGGDLVWELGSGYFGARDGQGRFDPDLFAEKAAHDEVKMIEIKLSQGAKPGHGGMLPAAKVTEEIAEARKVNAHQDCLSPRGHSAFSTPHGLMQFVARLRELSLGKPVGLKLCIGQPHEPFALVKAMLESGIYPDFIVVDGGEGGTGAAPLELSDWVGMPLTDGLILMRNALVGAGIKDKVRLVASGKVYSGMGVALNLAIGADWCNAARAFMMSVGCIQARRCHLGTCPTGVTAQSHWRQRGLVPHIQAERAARFHKKTLESLAEMTASAGLTHPLELEPHHIMHRTGPEKAQALDSIHVFLPDRILVESPEETIYADWWAAATPHSFRPSQNLRELRATGTESTRSIIS